MTERHEWRCRGILVCTLPREYPSSIPTIAQYFCPSARHLYPHCCSWSRFINGYLVGWEHYSSLDLACEHLWSGTWPKCSPGSWKGALWVAGYGIQWPGAIHCKALWVVSHTLKAPHTNHLLFIFNKQFFKMFNKIFSIKKKKKKNSRWCPDVQSCRLLIIWIIPIVSHLVGGLANWWAYGIPPAHLRLAIIAQNMLKGHDKRWRTEPNSPPPTKNKKTEQNKNKNKQIKKQGNINDSTFN